MLTRERLAEVLSYDQHTGRFTSLQTSGNRKAGHEIGCQRNRRYGRICIDGIEYLSHRLAWLYVHGSFPSGVIDHINGDSHDNRIENLRDTSQVVNMQNVSINRLFGQKNTAKRSLKPYRAVLRIDGKRICIGYFDTQHEAHEMYIKKKAELHHGWERKPLTSESQEPNK